MVRHRGRLGTVIQTVFSLGFFFLQGMCPCGPIPPPLEWFPCPPLVVSVLITPKVAESADSSRMGVIGALDFLFPSEVVQDKLHSP